MRYNYYPDYTDPSKYSVADDANHEGRGVITKTEDGKWKSEMGRIFETPEEAANHNTPPPVRPSRAR